MNRLPNPRMRVSAASLPVPHSVTHRAPELPRRPRLRASATAGWRRLPALLCLGLVACGAAEPETDAGAPSPELLEHHVELVPRTPFLVTYPCGPQCHDGREPNATPRELVAFHAGRRIDHGPANGWCDRCHALDHLDQLAQLDGTRVSFDESDRICAQCHGEKHRDWSAGLHGLSTGGWTGTVRRRQCTACHDPHTPGRIQLEALPPPRIPGEGMGHR